MQTNDPFYITFSGITIQFIPHSSVTLPEEFLPLLTDAAVDADATYDILPLDQPLSIEARASHRSNDMVEYLVDEGRLRIYSLHRPENGAQVACLLRPDNRNTLYYPTALWHHYTTPIHCSHLIGIETILIQHDAFLLHSSVVVHNGRAILFTGPSGAGKSTQANLWRTYLGADILNGDRCVIMERTDGFYGGGSPLAGHSHIYRPEQAPIAGIFLVEHAPDNRVQRLGFEALSPLLSQTLVNSWNSGFMEKVSDLFQRLLEQVPVYRLSCRPDKEAVKLVFDTIF